MPGSPTILAVTNMYPTDKHPTLGVFIEQQIEGLREIGLKVHVLFIDRTTHGMSSYLRVLPSVRAAVEDQKPSLLHVMYGGVLADRATRWRPPCPTVVTFHGSDLLGENFSGLWRKWISHYGVRCSRRAARRAQGLVVVSRRLKAALPQGLAEEKVRIIPCGIDLERFRPMPKVKCQRTLGWDERRFHVLFVSNNGDPVKRPWLAAAAVEKVNEGGLPAELHFMRHILNTEVPVWMNASDALLLTSAHEGSPTVVKEALACGLPIVSVDVGDVPERVEGLEGCYIASAEPADLASKLAEVSNLRGRNGRQARVQELGLKEVAFKLSQFYQETLSKWDSRPDVSTPGGREHRSAEQPQLSPYPSDVH